MRVLEYSGLNAGRLRSQYEKVCAALERDDFRGADARKLSNITHGKFYRAKLDAANRVLFSLVRHQGEVCVLMLEIIEQHAYDKSRFLRGAVVDENAIVDLDVAVEGPQAEPVRYLHPRRREVHLLDKVLSFDDAQEAVYRLPAPLIVVGGAGSGKTALTLEKLKLVSGEVLYVTQSAYLAQSARDLYFGHGFEPGEQEAQFLSFREFVESLRVPVGREATWSDFSRWFARQQQAFKGLDAHQVFEEIRGVITAGAGEPLGREDYLALGVRQSIFAEGDRVRVYDLFERYGAWLKEAGLFDLNLVSHVWRDLAAPRYDFVVIDEVQDLTNAQLALVLATLKKAGQFLLCGDSNQIVHPNFFAWSRVKSLFWADEAVAARQELRVLRSNFRNGREATQVANQLLRVKQQRFGSIDRESNFLVEAVGQEAGTVALLPDTDAGKRELNQKTRQSTRFAVLVMREEDKGEARRHFQTPLIFSVQEAKGLEYDNIVLFRLVSGHRAAFATIAEGVSAANLTGDELEYRRARGKTDRALEVYKFYVNALYVALTRAVRNVYMIESDQTHPLLGLLGLRAGAAPAAIEASVSTLDDWRREARKLELQGKVEQAAAIRSGVLKTTPVPWPVFDEAAVRDLLGKVFRDKQPGGKPRQQLYDYATCHDEPVMAQALASQAQFSGVTNFAAQRLTLGRKHYINYFGPRIKDILQQCERHGVDHRTPMNQTPLMAAAAAGNMPLVEALLERGADPELTDHLGRNALHWAMEAAFRDASYARGSFAAVYDRVAPSVVDVMSADRLVRIGRNLSEYFLFQTLWVLFRTCFHTRGRAGMHAFSTAAVLEAWASMPHAVLSAARNRRAHLSQLLSRNEVERDYAYNRRLFMRVAHGWYLFDPGLAVRRQQGAESRWVPILEALNLSFVAQGAAVTALHNINQLRQMSGQPALEHPFIHQHLGARLDRLASVEKPVPPPVAASPPQAPRARIPQPQQDVPERPAPWGTPQARQTEIERLRREIAARAAEREAGAKSRE